MGRGWQPANVLPSSIVEGAKTGRRGGRCCGPKTPCVPSRCASPVWVRGGRWGGAERAMRRERVRTRFGGHGVCAEVPVRGLCCRFSGASWRIVPNQRAIADPARSCECGPAAALRARAGVEGGGAAGGSFAERRRWRRSGRGWRRRACRRGDVSNDAASASGRVRVVAAAVGASEGVLVGAAAAPVAAADGCCVVGPCHSGSCACCRSAAWLDAWRMTGLGRPGVEDCGAWTLELGEAGGSGEG